MADIICAKCAEPWENYGLREEMGEGYDKFMKGEGCPSCSFGERCSSCDGSGREDIPYREVDCKLCRDRGYILAWQPRRNARGYSNERLYTGYAPNVTQVPGEFFEKAVTLGVRTFPEKAGSFESADGWVDQWWVACPNSCADREREFSCTVCDGKGTLLPLGDDLELRAARSEINASDEDPMDILARRGLA